MGLLKNPGQLRPVLVTLALPLLVLVGRGAVAARAENYGAELVRVEASWPDGSARQAPDNKGGGLDPAQLGRLEQQLLERELAGGPYADQLEEPLWSIGRYYSDQGKYSQALAFYSRALQLVRINDGLYGMRQGPLVREILQLYRDSGEWQALDDRYDYFFNLYGSGRPPYTEVRLRAAAEYLRWQREAWRREVGGNRDRRLLDTYDLNQTILEQTSAAPDLPWNWRRELVMSQLRNLYLVQTLAETESDSLPGAPGSLYYNSALQRELDLDLNQQRLQNLARTVVGRGRSLIEEFIEQSRDQPDRDLARLYLELGDWYQWNGQVNSALEEYRRALQVLEQAGEGETIGDWFGEPVELPDNGAFWQQRADRDAVPVQVTFDVSARGRVEEVQVDGETNGARVRRRLQAVRFRPRMTGGEAQAVAGLQRRYYLYLP